MLGVNGFGFTGRFQLSMIGKLLLIAWLLPNTQQIMAKHEPAFIIYEKDFSSTVKWFEWQPNLIWMILILILASQSILKGDDSSEFLYFQF